MTRRAKSAQRREEIIRVALDLLAETPLARLTTRQIAKQLDLSQPALFRHFRTREQLLLGVMQSARAELGAIGGAVLAEAHEPMERLRLLATRLLDHVQKHPGLARLLFAPPQKGPMRDALRQLVSMQQSLVGQFIRDGQEAGTFRGSVDAREAAMFFVGMIQGIVLRAQLADTPTRLADEVEPMMSLWLDGARSMDASASARTDLPSVQPAPPVASETLIVLDVRPILAGGDDPLEQVMSALGTVRRTGVLTITAPFKPTPLVRLLSERGHLVTAREAGKGVWSIDVVVGGLPAIDELVDLEPPEPLERVLEAASSLPDGGCYLARLPRYPRLLVPQLRERPVRFSISEAVDGTALVHLEAAV